MSRQEVVPYSSIQDLNVIQKRENEKALLIYLEIMQRYLL